MVTRVRVTSGGGQIRQQRASRVQGQTDSTGGRRFATLLGRSHRLGREQTAHHAAPKLFVEASDCHPMRRLLSAMRDQALRPRARAESDVLRVDPV